MLAAQAVVWAQKTHDSAYTKSEIYGCHHDLRTAGQDLDAANAELQQAIAADNADAKQYKATPRPWELLYRDPERRAVEVHPIGDTDGDRPIADVLFETMPAEEAQANAALIVKCVNSHDWLVEACEDAERHIATYGGKGCKIVLCTLLAAIAEETKP